MFVNYASYSKKYICCKFVKSFVIHLKRISKINQVMMIIIIYKHWESNTSDITDTLEIGIHSVNYCLNEVRKNNRWQNLFI